MTISVNLNMVAFYIESIFRFHDLIKLAVRAVIDWDDFITAETNRVMGVFRFHVFIPGHTIIC